MIKKINILSITPKTGKKTGGPNKVFHNLCKGLNRINVTFSINESPLKHKYNLVQSSIDALIDVGLYRIPSLIGPNLVVLPRDLPPFLKLNHTIFLHPAEWCKDLWDIVGYNKNSIVIWPVGIDWEEFVINRTSSANRVLIYFKRRNPLLLKNVLEIASSFGMDSIIVEYGKYTEQQYKEALSVCKLGIWIGTSESQGIAQQEALASGLPLIILDVNSFWDEYPYPSYPFPRKFHNFKPTSAPYFDKQCGIIIESISQLPETLETFLDNINNFDPMTYIQSKLTLEKAANQLLGYFTKLQFEESIRNIKNISIPKNIMKNGYRAKKYLVKSGARFKK